MIVFIQQVRIDKLRPLAMIRFRIRFALLVSLAQSRPYLLVDLFLVLHYIKYGFFLFFVPLLFLPQGFRLFVLPLDDPRIRHQFANFVDVPILGYL